MSDLLLSHLFRDILISYCIFPVIPHLDIGIITVITIILCQLGLVIGGNGIVRNWPVYITLIQSEIQCVRTGRNTVRILIVGNPQLSALLPSLRKCRLLHRYPPACPNYPYCTCSPIHRVSHSVQDNTKYASTP